MKREGGVILGGGPRGSGGVDPPPNPEYPRSPPAPPCPQPLNNQGGLWFLPTRLRRAEFRRQRPRSGPPGGVRALSGAVGPPPARRLPPGPRGAERAEVAHAFVRGTRHPALQGMMLMLKTPRRLPHTVTDPTREPRRQLCVASQSVALPQVEGGAGAGWPCARGKKASGKSHQSIHLSFCAPPPRTRLDASYAFSRTRRPAGRPRSPPRPPTSPGAPPPRRGRPARRAAGPGPGA